LFLLYLAGEGVIRFVGGVCVSELVPSLPVTIFFALRAKRDGRREQDRLRHLAVIPDEVTMLEGGEKVRIATACHKPNWNAGITIGIGQEHYEVEGEEKGAPPRNYIYRLTRAPIGKIMRGYEEYDVGKQPHHRLKIQPD
jgi:hypothetical protein